MDAWKIMLLGMLVTWFAFGHPVGDLSTKGHPAGDRYSVAGHPNGDGHPNGE